MSGFLVDTNIISETIKEHPEQKVLDWFDSVDESLLFVSVLTLGEIRRGIAGLPKSSRRIQLEACLDGDVVVRFDQRILPITHDIADRWGRLNAKARAAGTPMPAIDALLAATALHHNLLFATRDVKNVAPTNVPTFNPWDL